MKSYTADDARRRFGEVLKLAGEHPVEITRHKDERFILMSRQVFDAYEHIRRAHAEERILVTIQSAIGKILKNDEAGFKQLRLSSAMIRRFFEATGEKL